MHKLENVRRIRRASLEMQNVCGVRNYHDLFLIHKLENVRQIRIDRRSSL